MQIVIEITDRMYEAIKQDRVPIDIGRFIRNGTPLPTVTPKQQTCEDCISRQAAIETVMECYDNDELFEVYEDKLRELPSAQPEQRWIPMSERPPKVREWVLCQCRAGIMDVLRLTEDGYWNKIYPHAEYMSGFVTAWMPLPKPYKAESEGQVN